MVTVSSRPVHYLGLELARHVIKKPNPSRETVSINDKIVDGAPHYHLENRWSELLSPKIYSRLASIFAVSCLRHFRVTESLTALLATLKLVFFLRSCIYFSNDVTCTFIVMLCHRKI